MKNRLWLLQIPIVILFTFAFHVTELGTLGELENRFLREKLFPFFKTIAVSFTDGKFRIRGKKPPNPKIIIVDVDNPSIDVLGRWPWHRDLIAYLVTKTVDAGAKVVGLDIVFSEEDRRVPPELGQILKANNMGTLIQQFETDYFLEQELRRSTDKIVMGYMTDHWCQPKYVSKEKCPLDDESILKSHPPYFEKFSYDHFKVPGDKFDIWKTPFLSIATFISNLPMYGMAASHSGYVQVFTDPDGTIRRTALFMMADGKPYPSLALEMAKTALNEELELELDKNQKVKSIKFAKSGRKIPVNPMGVMEMNFHGPGYTYQYVSALDVMGEPDQIDVEVNRKVSSVSKSELLKDALVIIGVTAVGVNDMRSFPFDGYAPGVEGQATILENLIAGDSLIQGTSIYGSFWIFFLMIVGALGFAYMVQRLEAIPALLVAIAVISGVGAIDEFVFFANNINWNTGFFYIEILCIFAFVLSLKYVLEEQDRKFIKGAFAKYVAPAIVDSILKDPTKLTVGGERRELTILFSDIRGFTTLSEKMDAKTLATFLNEYLGVMTDLVFAHEGTLDKYIGDAVMAFWGAPLNQPNHAYNSCHAAIMMIRALDELRPKLQDRYGVDVQIGIGINSGPVNVGNMGSSTIFEYTVIGDHVNLASRLEGLTKEYKAHILTTRFTMDLIPDGSPPIATRVLDFVKVKGKKQAVELIEVLTRDFDPATLATYAEARALYTEQKWDDAIEKFRQVIDKMGGDGPAELFIDRCEYFKLNPPEKDWDGAWTMTTK